MCAIPENRAQEEKATEAESADREQAGTDRAGVCGLLSHRQSCWKGRGWLTDKVVGRGEGGLQC
jgi:hypothetical protein